VPPAPEQFIENVLVAESWPVVSVPEVG